MKRIPRIKFPQRHPKSSSASDSASGSQNQAASTNGNNDKNLISNWSRSDVPRGVIDTSAGGKATLQPKRTPVSEREIEAILLGGCF